MLWQFPNTDGEIVKNLCGNHTFEGREIKITSAVEEVFIRIRNFS